MSNWFVSLLLVLLGVGLLLNHTQPLLADAFFRIVIVSGAVWGTAKANHSRQQAKRKKSRHDTLISNPAKRWYRRTPNPGVTVLASAVLAAIVWVLVATLR